jgi:hypothetical protein
MELTEVQILILRGLAERPTVDIPAVIVDELIDVGYVTARTIDDRTLYEITDDGRAALDRMDGA